jgi:hypothetical protein
MEVLAAHRERVAHLRETLDRLIAHHRRLFELRSESWLEQEQSDPARAKVLEALHRQIEEVEDETERLRALLEAEEPPSGSSPRWGDPAAGAGTREV